jgi:ribonucleotide monophosphatase NagD (HAD superfamily)
VKRRQFLILATLAACKTSSSSDDPAASRASVPWTPDRLVTSADLAKELAGPQAQRPRVVHVGPERLFKNAHVPGAIHAGEAGDAEGLEAFARWLAPVPRDVDLVVYCGCCPYKNCPNIRPAYSKAVATGFTHVRVLDLPTTLKADWTEHGLPTESG